MAETSLFLHVCVRMRLTLAELAFNKYSLKGWMSKERDPTARDQSLIKTFSHEEAKKQSPYTLCFVSTLVLCSGTQEFGEREEMHISDGNLTSSTCISNLNTKLGSFCFLTYSWRGFNLTSLCHRYCS